MPDIYQQIKIQSRFDVGRTQKVDTPQGQNGCQFKWFWRNPGKSPWHALTRLKGGLCVLWHALTRSPILESFGIIRGHIIFKSVKECQRVSFSGRTCKTEGVQECHRSLEVLSWMTCILYRAILTTRTKKNESIHKNIRIHSLSVFHKKTGSILKANLNTMSPKKSYPHTLCQRWEVALSPFGWRFRFTTAARHDAWMRAGVEVSVREIH